MSRHRSTRRQAEQVLPILGIGAILGLVVLAVITGFLMRANDPEAGTDAAIASPPDDAEPPTVAEASDRVVARQLEVPGLGRPLAPGSCWLLPPTGEARDVTVFLDPGHGGQDPGATGLTSDGKQVLEKDATLAAARAASDRLRTAGFGVVLSRTTDHTVLDFPPRALNGDLLSAEAVRADLRARAACANAGQADVLISLHFNAYDDPGVGGVETLWDNARTFSPRSARLADHVQAELVDSYAEAGVDVDDRGSSADRSGPALTSQGAAYGHLLLLGPRKAGYNDDPSRMPGVVTELAFLTRPEEADFAASPRGRQVMADALARGIESFVVADD